MADLAHAIPTTAQELAAREPAPSRRDSTTAGRPRLGVVDRRRHATRAHRRQARVLRALGALFVVGALGVTAVAHTFVASYQQRIDILQGQLTQTLAEQQDLQLSRAELESPVRVLSIAEKQLGMVSPGSASYLSPVDPGPSVLQAQAQAARSASISSTARKVGSASSARSAKAGVAEAKSTTGAPNIGTRPPAIATSSG